MFSYLVFCLKINERIFNNSKNGRIYVLYVYENIEDKMLSILYILPCRPRNILHFLYLYEIWFTLSVNSRPPWACQNRAYTWHASSVFKHINVTELYIEQAFGVLFFYVYRVRPPVQVRLSRNCVFQINLKLLLMCDYLFVVRAKDRATQQVGCWHWVYNMLNISISNMSPLYNLHSFRPCFFF